MPRLQLACRYGLDKTDADLGVVEEVYTADLDLSVIRRGHPGCVVVPFDGDYKDLEDLGRFGPEPELLGDPPTAIAPSHAELDAAGVPRTIVNEAGEEVKHPLRAIAGKVYPDNRQRDLDTRPYLAPREWSTAMLLAYAAQERWNAEVGGISVNDVSVATDRDSQALVERLASRAARDKTFAPAFKAADGVFHDVGNDGLVAIGNAVSDHVAACFAAEETLKASIEKGKATHRADVDKVFAEL